MAESTLYRELNILAIKFYNGIVDSIGISQEDRSNLNQGEQNGIYIEFKSG